MNDNIYPGELNMLKKLEVTNYKGFDGTMVWDLSIGKFSGKNYNASLVKNRLPKLSTIFGKNGSGKSSLCTAIVDITNQLLDTEKDMTLPYLYTFVGNDNLEAEFKYTFQFGKNIVIYHYRKTSQVELTYESLFLNGKEVIHHNFLNESENFITLKGAENLRTNGLRKQLSVIKFIYNNTIQGDDSVIVKLIKYVSGMLYFRSMQDGNRFIGYKLGGSSLDDIILRNNKLDEFQKFLNDMGLDYQLVPLRLMSNATIIGVKFANGKVVSFLDISSSGSRMLMLFYCWLLEFPNLTMLVIDEFDAYYHFDVALAIMKVINSFDNLQAVVTTHNVTLLGSDMTRPDCAFIIDRKGTISLANRRQKAIRKNNSIEKIYREGGFD